MENLKITVFTPTYNRGYCLENVYISLLAQKYKNFEWLIVDDGSVDNTKELVEKWRHDNKIFIRYYYQINGGQHRALNKGIELAEGNLLMIVDSDDELTPDSLYYINYFARNICNSKEFGGVSGLRKYRSTGITVGQPWPDNSKEYLDITNTERYKYNILLGDKAEAYFVDVLRKYYPIPTYENENDVEKGLLWNRIAKAGLKVRWFNRNIYISEYLDDGMSKNIEDNYKKNFNGYCRYIREFIHCDIGIQRKIKTIIVTCEISRKAKINPSILRKKIDCDRYYFYVLYFLSYFSPLRKIKKWRKKYGI